MIFTLIVLNFVTQKVDVDELNDKRNAKFDDLRESSLTMSSSEFWILSVTMKIQYVTREEYPVNLFFERSQYNSTVPE